MTKAQLNNKSIATVAGNITVFNYDGDTREYLSTSVEYLAVGVGIPANSCIDAPGENRVGMAICRTENFANWEYVVDYRGETVYNTKTGEAVIVTALGYYPDNTTELKPATPYDKWSGSEWVTDMNAQHAAEVKEAERQKAALLAEAHAEISLWQTELQLGTINAEDKASLIEWLAYIKLIQAIKTSIAPEVNWPEKPAV
ncbi:TPA: tail fiber assembly protein [Yersinia enterocolitica]|nr:tail fiber assembly protein [Yersinia enterocolitica]